jgi:hypothetical protein
MVHPSEEQRSWGEAPRSERERPPSREDLEWSTRRKIQVILGSVGVVALLAVLSYAVPAVLKKPASVVAAPAAQSPCQCVGSSIER